MRATLLAAKQDGIVWEGGRREKFSNAIFSFEAVVGFD